MADTDGGIIIIYGTKAADPNGKREEVPILVDDDGKIMTVTG